MMACHAEICSIIFIRIVSSRFFKIKEIHSRARFDVAVGRIWPAGWTLPTAALDKTAFKFPTVKIEMEV